MAQIFVPFTCEKCEKMLAATVDVSEGVAEGGHTAKCPNCGWVQGSFPGEVSDVYERGPLE